MTKRWIIAFSIISTGIILTDCGKKKEAQQPSKPTSAAEASPPTPTAGAAPVAETTAPPPPPNSTDSYDAVVTVRSIDYLQGLVARKNWARARAALKQVQTRSLTPEQQRYVDSLKGQIPP